MICERHLLFGFFNTRDLLEEDVPIVATSDSVNEGRLSKEVQKITAQLDYRL